MAKKVALITIHGMGKSNKNYYMDLVKKLKKHVGKSIWDEDVHFESVNYQNLLKGNQKTYWKNIDRKYSLNWVKLRKFMLYFFSDAVSIEHSLRNDMELYLSVHKKIADAFDNSFQELGNQQKPVIVMAHSLGAEQISNYIWDAKEGIRFFSEDIGSTEQKEFRRLSSCHRLITTGCNIPIFRAGLNKPQLYKRPNPGFNWDNYFDIDDVLGYPVKELSDDYDVEWIEDKLISVGGFFNGWNPLSHEKYWTDNDVVKPIANEITRLLNS